MRLAVLGSGHGSNLAAILAASKAGLLDAEVSLVLTDRPGARILERGKEGKVPALVALPAIAGEPRSAYDARLLAVLEAEAPDMIALAGFMRILGRPLVEAFRDRIVNIHPSLLPAFPGAHGVRDAMKRGVRLVGCTTHLVTPKVDEGPILLQGALPVPEGASMRDVQRRLLRLEHQIYPRTLQLFAEGRVRVSSGRAVIDPGPSWRGSLPLLDGALYPDAF